MSDQTLGILWMLLLGAVAFRGALSVWRALREMK